MNLGKENYAVLADKALQIRNKLFDVCVKAGAGHITSSFSCAELLVALYYGGILRYDPANPMWRDRDRFILSKGHGCSLLYSIFTDIGFMPESELDLFAQAGGNIGILLQSSVPGAEISSGSLGMGLGVGAGMAYAARLNRAIHMTVVLLGDGELYEGAVWEAVMYAGHNRLSNMVAIVDRNYMCASDFTETAVELEPLDKKWQAFGWNTVRIDGHDFAQIFDAFRGFRSRKNGRPLCVIAETVKGKGIDSISNIPLWHGVVPVREEHIQKTKKELNGE